MATKNFRSTVLEPTSEFAHGDKLRFTALATVGEVLKGSFSETTIGEDGVYSVDLQYGKHRIDYKPYEGVWRHFADIEVNADTLATTLQDLALASVPVTDDAVLVLQGILADATAAKTAAETAEAAAETALASIDSTVADAKAGFPSLMLSYLNSLTFYVDSDAGDDLSDGLTSSTAKRTIDSIAALVPSGSAVIVQLLGSSVHKLSKLSQFQNCMITFSGSAAKPIIEQSSSSDGFGRIGGEGNLFRFVSVKLVTAKFETGVTHNAYYASMIRGSGINTAYIYNCDIELRDSSLTYQHSSGIGSWIDVLISNGSVILGDKLAESQHALIGTSSSSGSNAFKLQISNLSIPSSTTMRQLVLANTSSCLTNVPELRV